MNEEGYNPQPKLRERIREQRILLEQLLGFHALVPYLEDYDIGVIKSTISLLEEVEELLK